MKAVALKIDFKLDDDGIVRVVDIGPGLSADNAGFRQSIVAELLQSLHALTGAYITPVFGEFSSLSLLPELLDVPMMLRKQSPGKKHYELDSDIEEGDSIIPYSRFVGHIETGLGHVWKQRYNTLSSTTPPIGFSLLAGYKILWNLLLKAYMPEEKQPEMLFWCNYEAPESVLEKIETLNSTTGYFVKIVNSSDGCGKDVSYVADSEELRQKLGALSCQSEQNTKKIFSIEPAYMTQKSHKATDYNATGRAFLTVGFDEDTNEVKVNIAEAQWMLPTASLQKSLSEANMMSNTKGSSNLINLTPDELEQLTTGLSEDYSEVFRQCFTHDDLFKVFESEDIIQKWLSWFPREHSSQARYLDGFKDMESNFTDTQRSILEERKTFFLRKTQNIFQTLQLLIEYTRDDGGEYLSRLTQQQLLDFIEGCSLMSHVHFEDHGSHNPDVSRLLSELTKVYLYRVNQSYDLVDLNRALRQAVVHGDIAVAKLLIYTRQVDVNMPAPKGKKQTPLQLAEAATHEHKDRLIQLLQYAGGTSPLRRFSVFTEDTKQEEDSNIGGLEHIACSVS